MAGVQKVALNSLNLNYKNAILIGILIAKSSPRIFGSKKKNGEQRGVTTLTIRDSAVDTINADVWGSEYYVLTFYERFLVGDVVEISAPKICLKGGDNEMFKPHVTSPFYLSLNEGQSEMCIHSGTDFNQYLPLLHIPTKPAAGYHGLAEVLKITDPGATVYVDLLVVVKTVKPAKTIRTKLGTDMTVRGVEIMDNTTPASIMLDMFDNDTIQRSEEWRPLESVLFIADARVSWRALAITVQVCSRTVITHQPHTADAEALRLYARAQANTRGGEARAWAMWAGARPGAATAAQVKERARAGAPFCATLHALLVHLDLDTLASQDDELMVRFADHTGEISARLPINVLEDALGYPSDKLKRMSPEERNTARWSFLLEQCAVKLGASPPRLLVLSLQRASPADPIPLY